MKLFPLILCLALSATALAESPTGFADIPFGAPLVEAQKTISVRSGIKAEEASPDRLTFTGGSFAGQSVSRWTLTFPGGKFAVGSVQIEDVKKPVYDDIKAQLTKRYGKPDSEKGHHSWDCLWEFRSDGRRAVLLAFEHSGRIVITYSQGTLVKAAPATKKSDL